MFLERRHLFFFLPDYHPPWCRMLENINKMSRLHNYFVLGGGAGGVWTKSYSTKRRVVYDQVVIFNKLVSTKCCAPDNILIGTNVMRTITSISEYLQKYYNHGIRSSSSCQLFRLPPLKLERVPPCFFRSFSVPDWYSNFIVNFGFFNQKCGTCYS